jgi:hypothetical protein
LTATIRPTLTIVIFPTFSPRRHHKNGMHQHQHGRLSVHEIPGLSLNGRALHHERET